MELAQILVRLITVEELPRIAPLWRALYKHQEIHGMLLKLPEDAYEQWAASFVPVLDRFASIFVAEIDEKFVGFLACKIRSLPPHFGEFPVGFISDVFVDENYRGYNIGRKLMDKAVDWFQQNGIARIELQVIMNNVHAREFYRRMGWVEELVQMVWQKNV